MTEVLDALEQHGLLLLTDGELPSLAGLVAGEPIRGSWWSHAQGGDIWRLANELEDRDDVTTARLVRGKVTYVHRRLWGALVGVASARTGWQLAGLAEGPAWLLEQVDEAEEPVRCDRLAWSKRERGMTVGAAARELEQRLLVHGAQVHTERGAHAKVLVPWARWGAARGVEATRASAGRAALEAAVTELGGGPELLPWGAR